MNESLPINIFRNNQDASVTVARRISDLIRHRKSHNQRTVLGLATGHTPIGIYHQLIAIHQKEDLDFSSVTTFNLDEYWPIDPTALQSYDRWMKENFFNHVNIPPQNMHIPSGLVGKGSVEDHCEQYEQAIKDAGGIDLQLVGIGLSGHVGFNEPGSDRHSRTRLVELDWITRKGAAAEFFSEEHVPTRAISMGIGTILDAREICLMAFGEQKAPIIQRTISGGVTSEVPASFLQEHPNASVYLDIDAASDLRQVATPWQFGSCPWDDLLERQAVAWLAEQRSKPILMLTDEDYAGASLNELLRDRGGAYSANLNVFKQMMKTITGWPAGKDGSQRILILSPHPDDDVVCMGGTMMRLVEQKHELHVSYMVNGSLAVFDHDVVRYTEFVRHFIEEFDLSSHEWGAVDDHITKSLNSKHPGDLDSEQVQKIKALIRRSEATSAAHYCGVVDERIHFLDMPFYKSGMVQKQPITQTDIASVFDLFERVKPQIIFAAGDMSDPHGTHRQCLDAALAALDQYLEAGNAKPQLWYYRGAWQEWSIEQINMAVPLSPDELKRKRFAIFRHESQKDRAMFPGPFDSREFWQRAEERNMATAQTYDRLGLPEYYAIEAFAQHPLRRSRQLMQSLENFSSGEGN